jgi:hypothetical protein
MIATFIGKMLKIEKEHNCHIFINYMPHVRVVNAVAYPFLWTDPFPTNKHFSFYISEIEEHGSRMLDDIDKYITGEKIRREERLIEKKQRLIEELERTDKELQTTRAATQSASRST